MAVRPAGNLVSIKPTREAESQTTGPGKVSKSGIELPITHDDHEDDTDEDDDMLVNWTKELEADNDDVYVCSNSKFDDIKSGECIMSCSISQSQPEIDRNFSIGVEGCLARCHSDLGEHIRTGDSLVYLASDLSKPPQLQRAQDNCELSVAEKI